MLEDGINKHLINNVNEVSAYHVY